MLIQKYTKKDGKTIPNLNCLCGNNSYSVIFKGTTPQYRGNYYFELHQCQKCNLVRTLPVPDISQYEKGYQDSTKSTGEYYKRQKPWCLNHAQKISKIRAAYPALQSEKVLEIGCNGGEVVSILNEMEIPAEGCDIDSVAVEYGKKEGLILFVHDFSNQELNHKYGIIFANHTFEHILSLNQSMVNISNSLVSGGILSLRVPNYEGWIAQIMRSKWGFLVPQQHIWHFTPKTLALQVESTGELELININCRSGLESAGSGVIKNWIKSQIASLAIKFNHGDEIIATFQKK